MSTKAELACVYASLILVDDDVAVTVSRKSKTMLPLNKWFLKNLLVSQESVCAVEYFVYITNWNYLAYCCDLCILFIG